MLRKCHEDKMIIAFETEKSERLDKYLKELEAPKDLINQVIHSSTFAEMKVKKIDNLIIISQKTFYDIFAKYGFLTAVGGLIVATLIHSEVALKVFFIFCLINIMLLSKGFRFLAIWLKLKIIGHKPKIKEVSNQLVIYKLIYELENGANRNIRTPKK